MFQVPVRRLGRMGSQLFLVSQRFVVRPLPFQYSREMFDLFSVTLGRSSADSARRDQVGTLVSAGHAPVGDGDHEGNTVDPGEDDRHHVDCLANPPVTNRLSVNIRAVMDQESPQGHVPSGGFRG
jgi:hypothetical protein